MFVKSPPPLASTVHPCLCQHRSVSSCEKSPGYGNGCQVSAICHLHCDTPAVASTVFPIRGPFPTYGGDSTVCGPDHLESSDHAKNTVDALQLRSDLLEANGQLIVDRGIRLCRLQHGAWPESLGRAKLGPRSDGSAIVVSRLCDSAPRRRREDTASRITGSRSLAPRPRPRNERGVPRQSRATPLHQSGRRDSNPQHSAWKADALPLSYARDD